MLCGFLIYQIEDAAKVLVTGLVLDVEADRMAVVIDFGADDGFDAGLSGCLGEFDCAVEVVFIGQSDGGQFVLDGKFDDGLDRERGIEEGVIAVEVERDGRDF